MLPMIDERLRLARETDLWASSLPLAPPPLSPPPPRNMLVMPLLMEERMPPEEPGAPEEEAARARDEALLLEPSPSPVGECKSARAIRRASSEASKARASGLNLKGGIKSGGSLVH
jgi:hypothetical protein